MYELRVFRNGERLPAHTERVDTAAQALERIPLLLADHGECERVEVSADGVLLFNVDCHGNRIG